jgi:hypothetical protein
MRSTREVFRPDDRLRAIAQIYAGLFELELPLWTLGVLADAYHSGKVDAKRYGGPQTQTAQGSLIETVAVDLDGTILNELGGEGLQPRSA